jgi:hypothetical protein
MIQLEAIILVIVTNTYIYLLVYHGKYTYLVVLVIDCRPSDLPHTDQRYVQAHIK